MSHEQSETVQLKNGKWVNVYGRRTAKAGQRLPDDGEYDTVDEAVKAAKKRSKAAGRKLKSSRTILERGYHGD